MQPNEKFRLAQVETNKICGVLPEKRQTDAESERVSRSCGKRHSSKFQRTTR